MLTTARRSIKIPPKEANIEDASVSEKYIDLLTSIDSIQTKHKETTSSFSASEPTVKLRTIIMITVIIGIAVILLITFGSPLISESEGVKTLEDLDFEIELLDSSKVMLSDYKGKPVILDFFAIYCGPCKTQIIELQKIQVKFPNVHIISISVDPADTISRLVDYASDQSMGWIVARDHTKNGASKFQVSYIPTMAFFNSRGIRKYETHPPGVTSETTISNLIIAD